MSRDGPVGRRTAVDVLLGVDPGNLAVFLAPNGVLLTREIPADAIVRADAVHPARWSGQ
jgi:putative RNA 2'-phosphotransferase